MVNAGLRLPLTTNVGTADRHTAKPPLTGLRHGTSETRSPLKSAYARYVGVVTAEHTLLQRSPLLVLPSSHASRPSTFPLPQVADGTLPTCPALFRGAGVPKRKSFAQLLVSSCASSVVVDPGT